jgi:hypothetical protein
MLIAGASATTIYRRCRHRGVDIEMASDSGQGVQIAAAKSGVTLFLSVSAIEYI